MTYFCLWLDELLLSLITESKQQNKNFLWLYISFLTKWPNNDSVTFYFSNQRFFFKISWWPSPLVHADLTPSEKLIYPCLVDWFIFLWQGDSFLPADWSDSISCLLTVFFNTFLLLFFFFWNLNCRHWYRDLVFSTCPSCRSQLLDKTITS